MAGSPPNIGVLNRPHHVLLRGGSYINRWGTLMTKRTTLATLILTASLLATPATAHAHPIPSDTSQRCPQFEQAFKRYGLKPVSTFSYIAWRESRCRIKATNIRRDRHGKPIWTLNTNGTYDSGLLQINSSWRTVTRKVCGGGIDQLMILDCNLRVAKYLLDNGGTAHWNL